jgi:hypothetical protein
MTRVGAERSDVPLVWPGTLLRPRSRLIYLDLNHWIGLAKANTGRPDGERWQPALEALRGRDDAWEVVIGLPLIMELTGIRRRAQRAHLTALIEELSGFASVLPLTTIAALEFEASLAAFVRLAPRFVPVALLGKGVGHAYGVRGGLRIRDRDGNDVTARARAESRLGADEFDRRLLEGERRLDRSVIGGPTDDAEEQEISARGWNPAGVRAGAEKRAQQERDQAAALDDDPQRRCGRLRDQIAVQYVALEIEEIREAALAAHGIRLPEALTTVERARAFTDSMPAGDIWIALRTAKHRNADSVWEPNDIFDIDALSVAAAYCDIVVTERHSAHVLAQAGVPERHGTAILTSLDQVAEHVTPNSARRN